MGIVKFYMQWTILAIVFLGTVIAAYAMIGNIYRAKANADIGRLHKARQSNELMRRVWMYRACEECGYVFAPPTGTEVFCCDQCFTKALHRYASQNPGCRPATKFLGKIGPEKANSQSSLSPAEEIQAESISKIAKNPWFCAWLLDAMKWR